MATATPKPTAIEFNGETGETIQRNLSTDEIALIEAAAVENAAAQAAQEAKAAARQSALAKLAELGLTEEEIQAL